MEIRSKMDRQWIENLSIINRKRRENRKKLDRKRIEMDRK